MKDFLFRNASRISTSLIDSRIIDRQELYEGPANIRIRRYEQDDPVVIATPSGQTDIPEVLHRVSRKYHPEDMFVCEVTDATLLGETQPIVFDEQGNIVLESVENCRTILSHRLFDIVRAGNLPDLYQSLHGREGHGDSRHFGSVFPLVRHPTTNYYHWLLGNVPKIRELEWYESNVDAAVRPLVAAESNWASEALTLAGIDNERAIKWTGSCATADKVVVPRHRQPYHGFMPSATDYRWLRERFRTNSLSDETWPDRILISRKDADKRQICNEDELADRLKDYGFQRFELSSLSVSQQVDLFSKAEIVVGPHGAGLTNIIFGEDLNVIEIHRASDIQPHYYILAAIFGFDYEFVIGKGKSEDLIVDVNAVVASLDG